VYKRQLTQGLFWAGVLATFAMALGTAITVSALTVAAVTARDLTARAAAKGGGALASIFYDALALGGTFLILAIGAVLVLGLLGPARPF
jgi:ABC-type nickel/cobalt efflux system permease component RcnA